MRVRTALALINQTLDAVLAEQEGEFDGDTRWAVAWFEQFGINEDWDPTAAYRLTVWEAAQQLIRALEKDGEAGAAALLRKIGGLGETARDLAYRLYGFCERKKWSQEALAYNSLVIAWPEIVRLARSERPREEQIGLGV